MSQHNYAKVAITNRKVKAKMTGTIRSAFSIIKTNKAAFIKIHLIFYALFLSTMAVTMAVPHLAPLVLSFVSKIIPLDGAARAYASGSIIRAALFTLMVNTLVATLWITLPSLVFRRAGVVTTMIFAFLYGFMLAPIGPYPGVMIPHTLTLLIEYEAYLVAALAAHLASNALRSDPVDGRREAISVTAILYVLVMPLLIIGAFYEAYEVIYLAPHFM